MWLVHQALYGNVESPSGWGHFRDNEGLSNMGGKSTSLDKLVPLRLEDPRRGRNARGVRG